MDFKPEYTTAEASTTRATPEAGGEPPAAVDWISIGEFHTSVEDFIALGGTRIGWIEFCQGGLGGREMGD